MTRMAMLVLAALLGLAGCAHMSGRDAASEPSEGGFDVRLNPAPLPRYPKVHVVDGYIVVNQEPIRLWLRDYNDKKRVTIAWQLAAGTSYTWPSERGVTFRPEPPGLQCLPVSLLKVVSCSFDFVSKAEYKYTLTVLENGKSLPPLDPYIFNME